MGSKLVDCFPINEICCRWYGFVKGLNRKLIVVIAWENYPCESVPIV